MSKSGMVKVQKFVGVYHRGSEERRFQGKPDRCFYVTYRDGRGKFVWEKIGWVSEGYSAPVASQLRSERIRAVRHGEELPRDRKSRDPLLQEVWRRYDEWLTTGKRHPRHDRSAWRNHIGPALGRKTLGEISPFDVEKIKMNLLKEGKRPSTAVAALVLVRQLYNRAADWGMWTGSNPVTRVKMPKLNNARIRFLSVEEADRLMTALELVSPQLYRMAMLSLHTGMRAGELFNLKWGDVDFANNLIHITAPKSGRREQVYVTETVRSLLEASGSPDEHVFKSRSGGKLREVPSTYYRTVKALGFNAGVSDPLEKVVFHSLRHTFASWLAIRGVPLYTIRELMRHRSIAMTERYAHLVRDHKREAAKGIERTMEEGTKEKKEEKKATE